MLLQPAESNKFHTKSYSPKCTLSSKKYSLMNIHLSKSLQNHISVLEHEYCYRKRKNRIQISEIKKELEERKLELAIMKVEKTRSSSERPIPMMVILFSNKYLKKCYY